MAHIRVGRWLPILCLLLCLLGLPLNGCSLPQVNAQDRLFLDLSLEFLGQYELPKGDLEGTPIGGLSGLTYDRQRDRFYAISDDRSNAGAARFYTLKLNLNNPDPNTLRLGSVTVEKATPLLTEAGEFYEFRTLDPEGIALSPRQTVYVASEGDTGRAIAPFIDEFDLSTGQWRSRLPIPDRFLPKTVEGKVQGMQDNLGFESLALNLPGFSAAPGLLEPFRLFAATESPLIQDLLPTPNPLRTEPTPTPVRLLHYLVGEDLPTLIAEHLYFLDPAPIGSVSHGLSDILLLGQSGHFLSLERSFGLTGSSARLFQFVIGDATDTSGYTALHGDLEGIQPVRKQLLFDLTTLDVGLDNLEGMALGPRLPDGSQSLLLVSDDNFQPSQKTQFLLFRLKTGR